MAGPTLSQRLEELAKRVHDLESALERIRVITEYRDDFYKEQIGITQDCRSNPLLNCQSLQQNSPLSKNAANPSKPAPPATGKSGSPFSLLVSHFSSVS